MDGRQRARLAGLRSKRRARLADLSIGSIKI
jgi:hypothetical protein